MPILPNTQDVNYQSLPFVATEERAVIYHFAAVVDEIKLPIPLFESTQKKELINKLMILAKSIDTQFADLNVRLFKLKFLAPGRIDDIFKEVKRPITIAKYDVVLMIVCKNEQVASKLEHNSQFDEVKQLFHQYEKHNIVIAKNIRKAGETYVHEYKTDGVFLFNYFYVEDTTLDFLPVWEHTSRWFAEYTKLDNSYLLKPVSGDQHFQYINHCYWPSAWNFVPQLIFKPDAKTFVLDNFSHNKAIAFPIIYRALY